MTENIFAGEIHDVRDICSVRLEFSGSRRYGKFRADIGVVHMHPSLPAKVTAQKLRHPESLRDLTNLMGRHTISLMVILLTNDDGINAAGLQVLKKELSKMAEVWVVAPDRERSATSHALTLRQPLKSKRVGEREISVAGTPTDCVILGVRGILGEKPDMVISGLNHGPNLGDDVFYSGTVAAAMEGTLLEIPSIAFSIVAKQNFEFGNVSICTTLIQLIGKYGLPEDTLLNVNIPNVPSTEIEGVKVTVLGKRIYRDTASEAKDINGNSTYSIGGELSWERKGGTDFRAIEENMVSVTPLHLDLTDYKVFKKLRRIEEDFKKIF